MLVSIIIPTYNRAHLIGETLDSVLAQTYTNWECIIVDDGSTDNTDEVVGEYVKKDSRFQYHHRPKDRPKGGNAARNYGFEVSKGDYVNWFDDDDVMHQDKLFVQVESLISSDFNFSVCQTLVFENKFENIIGLKHEKIYSSSPFEDYLTRKIVWMTPSAIWKRDFLQTLSYLFDEDLKAAQEWEFHCRVMFYCDNYAVTNQALVYIRKHSNSMTYNDNDKIRMWNYYLARKKVYDLLKNSKYDLPLRDYFKSYFTGYFRQLIVNRSTKKALKVCYYSITQYYTFSDKILLYFYVVSRCCFGIGYRFKYYFKL